MKYDVITIGAGMSGLIASAKALSRGKKTLLIAKGQGTLPLTSGCIDFWGYKLDCLNKIAVNPFAEIGHLIKQRPEHPYAKLYDILPESVGFLKKILSYSGYKLVGSLNENREVLTALGTVRPSSLIPASMAITGRDLVKKVVVIGFKGYGDFYPRMFLDNLENRVFPNAQKKEVKIIDLGIKGNIKSGFLASYLSHEEVLAKIIRECKLAISGGNIGTRISSENILFVFPAVLGEQPDNKIWYKLKNELSAQVIEVPGLPPSIPGQRLENAIMFYLRKMGLEYRRSIEVIGFEAKGDRIISLKALDSSFAEHIIEGEQFILATGSFWGGGLIFNKKVIKEKIFDLPVFSPQKLNNGTLFTSSGQPFHSAGVEIGEDFRALSGWENLYPVGSILAHTNYIAEKSGLGLALATGYKVGSLV